MRAPISVCLIVKNESNNLERCLSSIRPFVEEIVVVDTGSSDNSPEIAKKFADKFEVFTDCNSKDGLIENFSLARQRSFDLASKDWVLWIDGDDVVEGADKLLEFVNSYKNTHDAVCYMMPYDYARDESGHSYCLHYRERLVFPKNKFKWVCPVHEVLVAKDGVNKLSLTTNDVKIIHHREGKKIENERNLRILKKHVEVLGETDPRLIYYLGREYLDHNYHDDGIRVMKQYVEVSGWADEKYMAIMRIANAYFGKDDIDSAIEWCHKAIIVKKDWEQAYFLLGKIYQYLAARGINSSVNWNLCINYCKIGLSLPRPDTVLFVDHSERNVRIHEVLNIALYHCGRYSEAIESIDLALGNLTKGSQAYSNLLYNRGLYCRKLSEKGIVTSEYNANRKKIVFYAGPSLERWNPDTAKKNGIGGSETAMIRLSSLLAKKGHEVVVYGDCEGIEGTFDNVKYLHYTKYPNMECDVNIVSRKLFAFDHQFKAKLTFAWAHDVWFIGNLNEAIDKRINYYLTLSNWHKDFVSNHYPWVNKDKFLLTRNGIDVDKFKKEYVKRNKYKAVYSSSPDRGLDTLLDLWPSIKKRVPQAELHLFYGFYNWETSAKQQNNINEFTKICEIKEKILNLSKYDVIYHGKTNQYDLADHFMSAGAWLYPTAFSESSCITGMEAQAAGLRIVSSDFAALSETVSNRGVLIKGHNSTEEYRKQFVDHAVSAMIREDDKDREELSKYALDKFSWEGVADDWENMFNRLLP